MFSFCDRTEAEREAALSCVDIYCKVIGACAIHSLEDDFFPLGVEAQNVTYQPFALGQLLRRDVFDVLAACGIAFPVEVRSHKYRWLYPSRWLW